MGKRGKKQPEPPDEPARAHCAHVERLLVEVLAKLDWNLSRRPCIASAGVTDFRHTLVGAWYSPKQRRSSRIERLYRRGPFERLFVYRTVMLPPRPRGLDEYRFWLLVLAHEVAHVVGLRSGSFRWGPGWADTSWPQTTAWTIGTASSDSEERIAERTAELITGWLGMTIRDSWRDILGEITDSETFEAQVRAAKVFALVSSSG